MDANGPCLVSAVSWEVNHQLFTKIALEGFVGVASGASVSDKSLRVNLEDILAREASFAIDLV